MLVKAATGGQTSHRLVNRRSNNIIFSDRDITLYASNYAEHESYKPLILWADMVFQETSPYVYKFHRIWYNCGINHIVILL